MQKHQVSNEGYGIITTDEGQRVLSAIHSKQQKGESEKAFLCRMWNGKGDFVELSYGGRGFKNTSMSICIFIQPQPLISELCNFLTTDGLMDRFIYMASKPSLYPTAILRENYAKLQESEMTDFSKMFHEMFMDHAGGVTYKLSHEAQREYDKLVDSFAEYLEDKYSVENDFDEDKENIDIGTQSELYMTSSKNTIHILKLATAIHILNAYIKKSLGYGISEEISIVSAKSLNRGRKLLSCSAQQKSMFIQAARSIHNQDTVKIKRVTTFDKRVIKAVCNSNGPVISVRDLQRHLKGSLKDCICHELEKLEKDGFGKMFFLRRNSKKEFLKTCPTVKEVSDVLKRVNIDVSNYSSCYYSMNGVDKTLLKLCLASHHNHDEIIDNFKVD